MNKITDASKATWDDARWVWAKEQAQIIRDALKQKFPGVKFRVRKDRSTSIDVYVPQGSTPEFVKEVSTFARNFSGGSFDGMIDLSYSWTSWLDGVNTTPAYTEGTTGSMGYHQGFNIAPPSDDAELVRFGANYVFVQQDWK